MEVAMTRSIVDEAFAHHIWATERLFETCAALTPDQLAATAPGTYGSIHQTLQHLVESDRWYLHFYAPGDALPVMPEEPLLSLAELRQEFARSAEAWPQVLATETDGERDIEARGEEWAFHAPVAIRLAQVPHHGTDHRSQVCTILSTLGVEPPEIDVWAYGEATGRTREETLSPA
jgi:uncharacterized damage-inducible protein DinB